MFTCSFCHAHTGNKLTLCPDCEKQLLSVRADSPAYFWYVAAIRRALFG